MAPTAAPAPLPEQQQSLSDHASTEDLIRLTKSHVKKHMKLYDSSHSYAHIKRVLALTHHIANREQEEPQRNASTTDLKSYDPTLLTLSALLHDISDSKYLTPSQIASGEAYTSTAVRTFLISIGADINLAQKSQDIVSCVSYSYEVKNKQKVLDTLKRIPELAPVQDADRLDALGAIGVGRCFTYGATREAGLRERDRERERERECDREQERDRERERELGRESGREEEVKTKAKMTVTSSTSMNNGYESESEDEDEDEEGNFQKSMIDSVSHFTEKLEKLESMMKTRVGREMARERSERIRMFRGWFEEESAFGDVMRGVGSSQRFETGEVS